ncbi:hypothetical protein [Bacillus thuringiensis]|uniref:hypothetical protein n=1 Tax=Bacillus thuringiensis TaxID=1428 RepID=UPI000BF3B059|nr:hypothetical protein [Bacillus thuringiensis]PES56080.1 hypothetical protein CN499_06550 [Bacillus thuringiensis]
MKTIEEVIEMYESKTLDGRDLSRLAVFVPEESLHLIGLSVKEEFKGSHKHMAFTRENVLKQLEGDVGFAFEKALNRRGISASLMFEVVRMWNWILEEGLENWNENEYAQYGLPLFKATAIKYGFDNPIGEDTGSESKFAC